MAEPVLTAESVLALRPCGNWPAERIQEFAAKRGGSLPLSRVLRATSIPADDRIWLACQVLKAAAPDELQRWSYGLAERACRVHAADALDAAGLTEHAVAMRAVRIADEASAWAAGEAARATEAAARAATRAAAGDAAWATEAAARAAAGAAAGAAWAARDAAAGAAWDAARAAARAAARDAEQRRQIVQLRAIAGAL